MSIRDVLAAEEFKAKANVARPMTLEAHHQQRMRDFATETTSIVTLRDSLADLEEQLENAAPLSDESRMISDRIEALRRRIDSIEKDEGRLNYFLDVGNMLFQYFEAHESVARGDLEPVARAPIRMPANSVLSYFAAEPVAPAPRPLSTHKASIVNVDEGLNRDKMLERYLAKVDPTQIKSGIMPGSGIEPGWGSCPTCSIELTFYQNEALLGCPQCGYEEFVLVDSEKPSYKDPPREITYFAYKKINHFNEWLAQFQAKENTDIPQEVVESLMRELRKERISDPKKVKKEKIREILQKLKFSKMYDHVQQIKNRIQHQMTNLTLSKEQEEKLQYLFKEIQPAFIKYCPANRSNFLSYPYVLYKLCQLLEMDEFLPCFQLLKSREKLYQQDQVWENICKEMQWQFIKSI
jgi:predicted  nucleic acid-binding Zn-ribbon protein